MRRFDMLRCLGLGTCAVLSIFLAGSAVAQSDEASVQIQVGDEILNPTLQLGEDGIFRLDSFRVETDEYIVELTDVVIDPDPGITYSFSATDLGTPDSFGFIFLSAVNPIVVNPAEVSASVGGGLAATTTSATMTPLLGAPHLAINILGPGFQNAGVNAGNLPAGLTAPAFGVRSFSDNVSAIITPATGPFNSMGTTVSFSLSGGGASFGGSGDFIITQIPEPATSALVGLGLLGLVALRRAKSKV